MNEAADHLIQSRLAGLVAGRDDADWGDIVFRARRAQRRRRVLGSAGVAAVVLVGVASAVALTRPSIDFSTAPRSPEHVVVDFGRQKVIAALGGRKLGTLPEEARRITTVKVEGKFHTLYVTPTEDGGFCWQWSRLMGSCRTSRADQADRIGGGGIGSPHGFSILDGTFLFAEGARLVVTYADGEQADVPFVWVTEPIAAGFYLYDVPAGHERAGHEAVSLTLLDGEGRTLAKEELMRDTSGGPAFVPHREPGFGTLFVPPDAIYAERELLFDVRVGPHRRIGLWVAPKRGGGTCVWSVRSISCGRTPPPPTPEFLAEHPELKDAAPLMSLGTSGGNPVILCCRVDGAVARVELRYQDGVRESVTPKRGYLLVVLSAAHYGPGHRLEELVAYDAAGKVIGRKPSRTDGLLYPCARKKDYGYGVKMCP